MENMIAPRKDVDLLTFLELRQAHRAVEAAQVRNAYFFAFRARLDAARIVYKERDGSAELIIIIIIIIIGELEDRMAVKHISSLGGQEPIWHSHWGRGTRNPHHSLRNGLLLRPNDRSLLPSHSEIEPNTIRQVHI